MSDVSLSEALPSCPHTWPCRARYFLLLTTNLFCCSQHLCSIRLLVLLTIVFYTLFSEALPLGTRETWYLLAAPRFFVCFQYGIDKGR